MDHHFHTWVFERNHPLIRFYVWAWNGSYTDINFCKLFWAVVFGPLAILVKGLGAILEPIANRLDNLFPHTDVRTWEQIQRDEEEWLARRAAKLAKGPNVAQRLLHRIASAADKVAAFWQSHATLGAAILYAIGATLVVGIVGGFILLWILNPIQMLITCGIILGCAVVALLVILLGTYLDESGKAKSIGHFFKDGYHAVKYRTCPQITIEGATPTTEKVYGSTT